MKQNTKLALIWGGLYALCAGLGFVQTKNGMLQAIFALLSMGFFVPGGMLLYNGLREKNRKLVLRIRYLSLASLALTVVVLIGNVLTLPASQAVGDRMYGLLIFVSVPMISSQFWVLSLFLWACLLMGSFYKKPKKK